MSNSSRLRNYKNNGKADDFRRRMSNDVVELRKARKDQQLSKRRNFNEEDEDIYEFGEDHEFAATIQALENDPSFDIEQIRKGLNSPDPDEVVEATRVSRKILSKERNPPIDKFLQAGLVSRFAQMLAPETSTVLQFEAAWVLTNIASGTELQTRAVVEAGVCHQFMKLIQCPALNVVEQVLWGLANVAGTGAEYRNLLIQLGLVPVLVDLVRAMSSRQILATAAWCLSNLCRKMATPARIEDLLPALPTLSNLLRQDSMAIVSDACWALSYFTDGGGERIEAVCKVDVIAHLVALIGNTNEKSVLVPALRALGNIVTGDDKQTQLVVDHGALPILHLLLKRNNSNATKEVVWTLSNILAGPKAQIQAVLDEGLLDILVKLLSTGDYKCRSEAAWAISNLTCGGSPDQIAYLIRADALRPLAMMLEASDVRLVTVTLDAFGNILRAAEYFDSVEVITEALEEIGFAERLEMLQMHENEEIYKRAVALVTAYWSAPEDMNSGANSKNDFVFTPLEVTPKFNL